jgi:hypothetical protein
MIDKMQTTAKTIRIEHKVMGSLTTEQGDTVLSYTPGVSPDADTLCAMTAEGVAEDHASWLLLPRGNGACILHVQGAYTAFSGGLRSYATRVVYELSAADIDMAGGFVPVLPALHRMHPYEKRVPGTTPETVIPPVEPHDLSQEAAKLRLLMAYALVNHRRLFIRLGDDERQVGDEVRTSRRLTDLLAAVDSLPSPSRRRVGVAFSVEATERGYRPLMTMMTVVAHLDPVEAWGDASENAVLVDWTDTRPVWPQELTERMCSDALQALAGEGPAVKSPAPTPVTQKTPVATASTKRIQWIIVLVLLILAVLAFLIS